MTVEEMRSVDVRTVDRESLIDIKSVEVSPELPRAERFRSFVEQIKNPYCYRCGDVVVKVEFANTNRTLEDCLEQYIRTR